MAANIFSSLDANDVLRAGQQGWDDTDARINGIMNRRARVQAGRKLATGDRAGAASTFGNAGMIPEARQMQADQTAEDDRGLKLADDAQARTEHAEDRGHAETARKAGELKQLTAALRQVPPGKRAEFLQHALPILQQTTGIDPAPFQKLGEADLTDDHLATFDGEVDKHTMVNLGAGGVGDFNARTGGYRTLREPEKPTVLHQGDTLLGEDNRPVYTAPKTFAPPRARAGGVPTTHGASLDAIEGALRKRGLIP